MIKVGTRDRRSPSPSASPTPTPSARPDLQAWMGWAETYLAQGRVDLARATFREILRAEPEALRPLIRLGTIEFQSGSPDEAASLLLRAAQLDGQVPDWLNDLGWLLHLLGLTEKAQDVLRRAVAACPADPQPAINLALCLKAQERADEALEVLHAATQRCPDSAEVWTNCGNLLQELGRHQEALDAHQRALELAPGQAAVHANASQVLTVMHRHEEALAAAVRATELDPRHVRAWDRRAQVLRDLDRVDEALACTARALSIDPRSSSALGTTMGLMLADERRWDDLVAMAPRSHKADLQARFGSWLDRSHRVRLPVFRLKHELGQAIHLRSVGAEVAGIGSFIEAASAIVDQQGLEPEGGSYLADSRAWRALAPYLRTDWTPRLATVPSCLNADKDWRQVEDAYLRGSPEMLSIDDFLSPQALAAFQSYALEARVWNSEYKGKYLGAFAAQGFVSPLHLQLAAELRMRLPRVFGPHALTQLWAFKYDARLGTGIGVHADFAAVNLNFWITPDEFNLDPDAGGLKVYHVPAPTSWTFDQYNYRVDRIYEFLDKTRSDCLTVPYRCNRAVLFNSALFHETDRIDFVDRYEGRRVNMTYLFGRQLT